MLFRSLASSGEGLGSSAGLKLVLHQKRLDPVVVAFLVDPISDRHRLLRHLKPSAEGPGEVLKDRPGQSPKGGVEVLDRFGIEGLLAGISRSVMAAEWWPRTGCGLAPGMLRRQQECLPPADSREAAAHLAAGLHHPGPQRC